MKIFLDTADIESIKRVAETGYLDGVTTNPSKIAEAQKPFTKVIEEICSIVSGPVSAEAVGYEVDDLVNQAVDLAKIAPNVYVKMPMSVNGLKATQILEREKNVRVNLTMVFSSTQAYLAMKAGASFVSIVLSRLDNIANESYILVEDAALIKQNYGYASEVLAGSLKTQNHILQCLRAGADIVTIPESLFFQMFEHPLTAQGLAEFDQAWKKVKS
jgi:transaldolase